mmetsp:Transcript_28513/g.61114  ORF Transcript_28513/g.61114 Transcript_28513/m.61114 type:complete len:244 (+) Transcript_28513:941-1672(+)
MDRPCVRACVCIVSVSVRWFREFGIARHCTAPLLQETGHPPKGRLVSLSLQHRHPKDRYLVVPLHLSQVLEHDLLADLGRRPGLFRVALVQQDRHRQSLDDLFPHQCVQLESRLPEAVRIGRIDEEQDRRRLADVILPQVPDGLVAAEVPGPEPDPPGGLEVLRLAGPIGRREAPDVSARAQPVQHRGLSGIVESQNHQGPLLSLEETKGLPEGVDDRSPRLVHRLQHHVWKERCRNTGVAKI